MPRLKRFASTSSVVSSLSDDIKSINVPGLTTAQAQMMQVISYCLESADDLQDIEGKKLLILKNLSKLDEISKSIFNLSKVTNGLTEKRFGLLMNQVDYIDGVGSLLGEIARCELTRDKLHGKNKETLQKHIDEAYQNVKDHPEKAYDFIAKLSEQRIALITLDHGQSHSTPGLSHDS